MAAAKITGAPRPASPTHSKSTCSISSRCGLRARARHDLGGIEVTIRDHECIAETVLLAPEQGLARLLIKATLDPRRL